MWYGVIRCGMVFYDIVWCGMLWRGMVWCGMLWDSVMRCGAVRDGVVWYGIMWFVAAWNGMVWYVMLCMFFFIFTGGCMVDWNAGKDKNRLLVVSIFISYLCRWINLYIYTRTVFNVIPCLRLLARGWPVFCLKLKKKKKKKKHPGGCSRLRITRFRAEMPLEAEFGLWLYCD